MEGTIFLIDGNGDLLEMREENYDSEMLLQELLEKYPNLLAGDQMDNVRLRKWLLIKREAPIPNSEGSAGQWSADHLFVDQDAIPTIVEVKRSSDTRIRREVVGQMLEYAANATTYWSMEQIKADFESMCEKEKSDPEVLLRELLGEGNDLDGFWEKFKTNLKAGKIRMVFVADRIPPELQRIADFLCEQMDPAEVYTIEIKQYVGEGLKTLVPKVLGRTKTAASGQWNRFSFLDALGAKKGKEHVEVAVKILNWAEEIGLRITWGKGKIDGSFYPLLDWKGESYWTFSAWTSGYIQMQFQMMMKNPPFDNLEMRKDLQERLNVISGVNIPDSSLSKYPGFPLISLKDAESLASFTQAIEWYISEVKKAKGQDG